MKFNDELLIEKTKGSLTEFLHINFLEDDNPNQIVGELKTIPIYMQSMGIANGGINNVLAETVAGIGSNIISEPNIGFVGSQISTNHMLGVKIGQTVIATATLLHKGRRSHVWSVDVRIKETGQLASHAMVTNMSVHLPLREVCD